MNVILPFHLSAACACGLTVACVSTQHAREIYASEVSTFVGKPLSTARPPFKNAVGSIEPSEKTTLQNGNILHVYNGDNINGPCTLLVEFNQNTQLISSAHAEGSGCLTPY
jgi:hypothetical protein